MTAIVSSGRYSRLRSMPLPRASAATARSDASAISAISSSTSAAAAAAPRDRFNTDNASSG